MTEREQMVREEILLTDEEIIPILNELRPRGFNHIRRLSRDFKRDIIPLLKAQLDKALTHTDPEGNRLLGIIDPDQSVPPFTYFDEEGFMAKSAIQQAMLDGRFVKLIDSAKD